MIRNLAAYLGAAAFARSADAGAIVGIVLLTTNSGNAGMAGVLAAALTAPHLAGPFLAPLLDRSRRPRALLAGACVLYAVGLVIGAVFAARGLPLPSLPALVISGACGPLLTGGLSSQLGELVPKNSKAQRRAQGADALTYGLAATLGPGIVALVASAATSLVAVFTTAALAIAAVGFLAALPATSGTSAGTADRCHREGARLPEPPSVWRALIALFTIGALRRVTVVTALTAAAVGSLPLLALAVGTRSSNGDTAAALLVSVFGVGNLGGALLVTVRPLSGSPDGVVGWSALAIGVCLGTFAIPLPLPITAVSFGLAGVLSAMQFASSLSARAEYAPPGARAQIFVAMAGLKVAFSSLGVTVAGFAVTHDPDALLAGAAVLPALAFGAMVLDRTTQRRLRSQRAVHVTSRVERANKGSPAVRDVVP